MEVGNKKVDITLNANKEVIISGSVTEAVKAAREMWAAMGQERQQAPAVQAVQPRHPEPERIGQGERWICGYADCHWGSLYKWNVVRHYNRVHPL